MVEVGEHHKRLVTLEDAELYKEVIRVMEESAKNKEGCWHFGREDIGNLVTHLVNNYEISMKKVLI